MQAEELSAEQSGSMVSARDDVSSAYFPTRPFLEDGMTDLAREISDTSSAGFDVVSAAVKRIAEETPSLVWPWFLSPGRADLYAAAIVTGDCRMASHLVWDQLIRNHPFVEAMRHDDFFNRVLTTHVFQSNFPELAACRLAQQGRTLSAMIERYSLQYSQSLELVRPFQNYNNWFSASETLHGRRDWNYWQLIEMAAGSTRPDYGPAGVVLVELALELDSLDLPDDVLHMLLLRAEATWPETAEDHPVPVARERIEELLPLTAAPLSVEELAHAERCFMTDEPYNRLFVGEADYLTWPDNERCQRGD